jgi:hypothetical protein
VGHSSQAYHKHNKKALINQVNEKFILELNDEEAPVRGRKLYIMLQPFFKT